MNLCLPRDILATLAVVEMGLSEFNFAVDLGAGVSGAQNIFLER
jgi:hypothetical protein